MFCQVLQEGKKPKPVISVDYEKMVAIKTSGGLEEIQKLEAGTDGVCHCTWDDGTVYKSDVPALFLTCTRAPIHAMKVSKKRPAAGLLKKPAAAAEPEEEDEEDEEGEEEEQKEPDSELEEAEGPAKKAKPGGEEQQDCVDPRHIKGKPVGLVKPTAV